MKKTRRTILRTTSTLLAALVGAGTATAAQYPTWAPDTVYTGGDRVTWEGYVWEAQWWTRDREPAASKAVWEQIRPVDDDNTDEPKLSASISASKTFVEPGESVTFDATGSTGDIQRYEWEFGDGTAASGATVTHTYETTDTYTVTLTVTDTDGNTATDSISITVNDGESLSQRIVGYYMQWSQWGREYYPGDIPLDKVTHVNYAFLTVNQDGSAAYIQENAAMRVLNPQPWHDHTGFNELIEQATDTTFLFSIGGWNDSKYFSNAAQTQASRERFARTAIEIMREHGFDGLDIDWEYPGGGGKAGNIVREGDKHRYTLLLQEVRRQLDQAEQEDGREYELTAALSADPKKNDGLEHTKLSNILDFLNVMTYDYHGAFDELTNHQAPLHSNPNDPSPRADDFYVEASMDYWANTPFDNQQLSMGLPFYGRSYANVTNKNNGLFQPFDGPAAGSFPSAGNGIYDFWDINQNLKPGTTFESYWDDSAKAAWLFSSSNDVMVSYPNPESIGIKTDYATQNGFGGLMFWAFALDKNEVLLDAVHQHL
jgi:chitinase